MPDHASVRYLTPEGWRRVPPLRRYTDDGRCWLVGPSGTTAGLTPVRLVHAKKREHRDYFNRGEGI